MIIGDLINPKNNSYDFWPNDCKVGKWIFQIVSNPINNIDVDKFDYITRDNKAVGLNLGFQYIRLIKQARVYGDNIHYPYQIRDNIFNMFYIRYRLHRGIYNHKAVKAHELLILEAMFELEKTNKISEYVNDSEKMLNLIDLYLNFSNNENVIKIIKRIEMRDLPVCVYEKISKHSFQTLDNELLKGLEVDKTIQILKFKVGYTSGKDDNPLKNVNFYNTKNLEIINVDSAKAYSMLINKEHIEYHTRIYCMNKKNIENVKKFYLIDVNIPPISFHCS